jgi:hypothetical protein
MRTISLAILAAVLVYGLPASAVAQTNPNASKVCPPGQFKQNGVCVDRPRMGPGPGPRDGGPDDVGSYIDISDNLVCQGPGGYFFCSTGNTGPYPNVRRPPGH